MERGLVRATGADSASSLERQRGHLIPHPTPHTFLASSWATSAFLDPSHSSLHQVLSLPTGDTEKHASLAAVRLGLRGPTFFFLPSFFSLPLFSSLPLSSLFFPTSFFLFLSFPAFLPPFPLSFLPLSPLSSLFSLILSPLSLSHLSFLWSHSVAQPRMSSSITAHCSLSFPGSKDPPNSAS